MSDPSSLEAIAIVDDEEDFRSALSGLLRDQKYHVEVFPSAESLLEWLDAGTGACDLIISDIGLSGMSGYELCREIRSKHNAERIPIILITGRHSEEDKISGLEAGADDFVHRPVPSRELLAKVRSLLEIRAQEIVTLSELALMREKNSSLSAYLSREAHRSKRLGTLRKFVSPNVAEKLTSDEREKVMNPHRANVTVMFVDLRRFTGFAEMAEPEQVLSILGKYYQAVGSVSLRHGGTVGHLAGDGIMIFLNDPEPVDRHPEVGIRMAIEVRKELEAERALWKQSGYDLDFGIGLAEGAASIGGIGFDRFWHYSVIGPVTNLASRLCGAADGGQILISQRFLGVAGEHLFLCAEVGELRLKGMRDSVHVKNVLGTA